MKYALTFAAALYCAAITHAIRAETLTIELNNIQSTQGTLMIQIMQETEFKEGSKATAAYMRSAQEGSMRIVTEDLPAGDYAIRVMHDTNDNGKLDTNFVGMPKEPWAMSNNARGNFGPPTWDDVKFTLKGNVTQSLDLN